MHIGASNKLPKASLHREALFLHQNIPMDATIQVDITIPVIRRIIRPRKEDSHKGNYGHGLLIAGSKGKMGAAVIASKACLRTGIGLLTTNVPDEERSILQTAVPEAMLVSRSGTRPDYNMYDSIGIGPGIGTDDIAMEGLDHVLSQRPENILIDADAITLLSYQHELWKKLPEGTILTPHPKEFDRMFGLHNNEAERKQKALELSMIHPWVIILKGHRTLIAHNGNAYTNTTGNAGLAKGGSGDMLTGMITSFLAQEYTHLEAAIAGVFMHGLAADLAIRSAQSQESLLATDVIGFIGRAFKVILNGGGKQA